MYICQHTWDNHTTCLCSAMIVYHYGKHGEFKQQNPTHDDVKTKIIELNNVYNNTVYMLFYKEAHDGNN